MRRQPKPSAAYRMDEQFGANRAMAKGTPYAAFLDPGAPAQRGGVLSSFNMIAESLELLPSRDGSPPGLLVGALEHRDGDNGYF